MKLLAELRDEDIGEKTKPGRLRTREAARAVAFKGNKIAMMHVSNHGYYKLPGGGIERGESIREALVREMLEETGCKIKITSPIGKVIERRTHNNNELQTSYCFVAEVVHVGQPRLDEGEVEAGYKLEWMAIDEAIKILEKGKPKKEIRLENYLGKFIIKRDLVLLKAAKKILSK